MTTENNREVWVVVILKDDGADYYYDDVFPTRQAAEKHSEWRNEASVNYIARRYVPASRVEEMERVITESANECHCNQCALCAMAMEIKSSAELRGRGE